MSWVSELTAQFEGEATNDPRSLESASTDFGRIVSRRPELVVVPRSSADVARAVRFAAGHNLHVGTRGAGHSQSGQSLSDHILLDLSSLNRVGQVEHDPAAQALITCQAGTRWRALVEHLRPQRVAPPVLTNNLDVTVGGTLSTGGLGVASWRHGTQADQVIALEVVTGTGEVVRCSSDQNRELFDAVRAGVGQFGIITEATLRLRQYQPVVHSYYLLYDDLAALLNDLRLVIEEERFDYLESWCVPCPQGFKTVHGQRQAFAQWFYPLHATVETAAGASSDEANKLGGLKFYKHIQTEELETPAFFARLDPLFSIWKRSGVWDHAHPWMECVLPWNATQFYISQVLANMPPQAITGGHILLWPARGSASSVPLFLRPPGELVMGFGLLPAIPQRLLGDALPKVAQASNASIMLGGKRYLSGWVDFDAAQWKSHYGDRWPEVVALKQKFDPRGILNPGFVRFT
jgi:FAD/FMN-containing dehydrogenase